MVETTRTYLFGTFFVLLIIFSTGNLVSAYSVAPNQDCASNCERIALLQNHEQIGAFNEIKTPSVSPAAFTPAEQVGAIQPLASAAVDEVHAAAPRATPSGADATEGGSTPGPRFFLIIGSVLIGVRLIISHRSRKVRKLAAETH
jgi:hypothetical protein